MKLATNVKIQGFTRAARRVARLVTDAVARSGRSKPSGYGQNNEPRSGRRNEPLSGQDQETAP